MPASSNASTIRPRNAGPEPASAVAASNSRSSRRTTVPSCSSQSSTRGSAAVPAKRPSANASVPAQTRTPTFGMQRKTGTSSSTIVSSVVVGDAGGDRQHRALGRDQPRDLAQHALDVDRLDGHHDDLRALDELAVGRGHRDPSRLGEAGRAAGAAVAHDDARGALGIGPDPAIDHRRGHVAGADQAEDAFPLHGPDGTRVAAHQARVDSQQPPTNVGYKEGERHARCGRHPVTRARNS